MWLIQTCNEDGSRTYGEAAPFSTIGRLFDVLRHDFAVISQVSKTDKYSVYRLREDDYHGCVYVRIWESK